MENILSKTKPAWAEMIKPYQIPNHWKSAWQLANSIVPYFIIWGLMIYSLHISYWITVGLALLNALFMMRIFIIQHDCGHNSFFKSTKLNDFVGSLLGVITLTPYYLWRRTHAKHHASSGDLDLRGFGDIKTVTVEEYEAMSSMSKFTYRVYRNPLVKFGIGPLLLFVFAHRFAFGVEETEERERKSVYATNIALAFIFVLLSAWLSVKEVVMLWLPMMIFASSIGVYLFYVQHQFEDTYWRWHEEWDYTDAALRGSSFFKLPKLLQWFSGNIGFHHVHHLSPRIPNYNLERAHYENDIFKDVQVVTLASSFKTIFLHLWDEQTHKLISWRDYQRLRSQRASQSAAS